MRSVTRFAVAALAAAALSAACAAQEMPADYQKALDVLGRTGDFKDKVFKVNIPRNDLKVAVDGIYTPTPFGFGGWIAMTKGTGGDDVMMGDLVLLEAEINPVMSALLDNGLEVTALHNHFFKEQPRIFYMHVHGVGRPEDLARRIKPALDLIGHVDPAAEGLAAAPLGKTLTGTIDTAKIADIVGHAGDQTGAVYKITIGRPDLKIREMGAEINARMGLNTWAAFIGSDQDAAIAGDVAMLADEVTPVLKALRANGLDIVAIHHHMTGTRPTIYFLHYWGRGPAQQLAKGFRAALNQLGKAPKSGGGM